MKIKRKLKKGFTLVELIVVIAIVAILAAVSVVSYLAFIRQANESADIQLVKQLNTSLQADQALNGVRETPTEMLKVMEENGFIIENLTKTKSGYDIVWDQGNNRFALLNNFEKVYTDDTYGNEKTKSYSTWFFVDSLEEFNYLQDNIENDGQNKRYATYLTKEFGNYSDVLNIKAGLDTGINFVDTVYYKNSIASQRDIIIATHNDETLVKVEGVLGTNGDNVCHFGKAKIVEIISIGLNSYHEYGHINGNLILHNGNLVVEKEAKINAICLDANSDSITTGDVILKVDRTNNENNIPIICDEDLYNVIKTSSTSDITFNMAYDIIVIKDVTKISVNNTVYSDINEAILNFKDKSVVRLYVDINEELRSIEIRNNLTIDLNGHNLYLHYSAGGTYGFVLFSNLTLIDSMGTGSYRSDDICFYSINNSVPPVLTLNSVNVLSDEGYCIYHNAGTVEVYGCTISSPNSYVFCVYGSGTINIVNSVLNGDCATNGSLSENTRTINFTNVELNGLLYKPDGGTLNIDGGRFIGNLYLKGGTTNILNGYFEGDIHDSGWKHVDGGWHPTGDAIIIEGCDYPSGAPFVNITGGTFKGFDESGNELFKNYGILAISYAGHAPIMSGTAVAYRYAVVASNEDENFLNTDGWLYFNDSNTVLINP